jgi:hypothetical protein
VTTAVALHNPRALAEMSFSAQGAVSAGRACRRESDVHESCVR